MSRASDRDIPWQIVAQNHSMSQRVFPNLFIIGAMKAGTSSLHKYLHQHPEIFMSAMKEPQYFAPHLTRWGQAWGQGNPYPEPRMDWYLRLFEDAGNVAYAGESSVSYTARPWVEGCEERIYEFNPDARLIYIMRDPVQRAMSHYWQFVKDGREDLDMLAAFERNDDYVARSNYILQLAPYLEKFGPEQIFALSLEELNHDPQRVLCSLFTWLQVDLGVSIDTSKRFNVAPDEVLQTRRHFVGLDTMLKHWRWRRIESRLPSVIGRLLRRITYRPVTRHAVDTGPAVRYLRSALMEYTHQLETLLGREFPEWRTLYGEAGQRIPART